MRISSLSVDFFLNDGGKFFSTRQKPQCGVVVHFLHSFANQITCRLRIYQLKTACIA